MTLRMGDLTGVSWFLSWALAFACIAPLDAAHAQSKPWPHDYMRGEYEVSCPDSDAAACIYHRLIVENASDDTLECRSNVTYDGVNRDGQSTRDHKMVVEPNTRKAVLADNTTPDVKVVSYGVECAVRPPTDDSKLTLDCKPTLTQKPTGSIDYPMELRRAGQEGPVLLEFTLTDREGPPRDIVVVGSSLWPKLDESAVKYVAQYRGLTDCKQGRFRLPLTFRLQ
jgi:TonB family protein